MGKREERFAGCVRPTVRSLVRSFVLASPKPYGPKPGVRKEKKRCAVEDRARWRGRKKSPAKTETDDSDGQETWVRRKGEETKTETQRKAEREREKVEREEGGSMAVQEIRGGTAGSKVKRRNKRRGPVFVESDGGSAQDERMREAFGV